jgi:hypothetical protein
MYDQDEVFNSIYWMRLFLISQRQNTLAERMHLADFVYSGNSPTGIVSRDL